VQEVADRECDHLYVPCVKVGSVDRQVDEFAEEQALSVTKHVSEVLIGRPLAALVGIYGPVDVEELVKPHLLENRLKKSPRLWNAQMLPKMLRGGERPHGVAPAYTALGIATRRACA
jgi:hypothetical protein